ncbi:hypothetical protein Tco_1546393 [Tanacetum coccineum]
MLPVQTETIDSVKAKDAYVSDWDITNDFKLDDDIVCRNFIDHIPLLGYWASLRNLPDAEILDQFSISVARQDCMSFELWLRKDREIVDLKSRLEKLERDPMKDVGLRGNVLKLDFVATVKVEELVGLGAKNVKLIGQVSSHETLRDELKSQIKGEEEMRKEFMIV